MPPPNDYPADRESPDESPPAPVHPDDPAPARSPGVLLPDQGVGVGRDEAPANPEPPVEER